MLLYRQLTPTMKFKKVAKKDETPPRQQKKKILLITLSFILFIFIENIFSSYKTDKIPEEIYTNTPETSDYNDFIYGKKKIIWYGTNCPISQARKNMIDKTLEETSLDDIYEHRPQLINQFIATQLIEKFFIENCANNICITLPEQQQLIIIKDNKKLFKILEKFKDL